MQLPAPVASFALLLLASCALARSTQNEPLDPQLVNRLEPGKTTAAQAVELLGAPSEVVQLGKRSAYRYDHTATKGAGLILIVLILGNLDSRQDRVWLWFDEHNVLSHVGRTFASHHAQYAMPWEDVHEAGDNQARDADRPGLVAPRK
jgi:hypothetical protein